MDERDAAREQLSSLLTAVRAGDTTISDATLLDVYQRTLKGQDAETVARTTLWEGAELCIVRPSVSEAVVRQALFALLLGRGYSVGGTVTWAMDFADALPPQHGRWLRDLVENGTFRQWASDEERAIHDEFGPE